MSIRTITGRVPSGQEMTIVSSFSDGSHAVWLMVVQTADHRRGQKSAGQWSPARKLNSSPLLNERHGPASGSSRKMACRS